MSISTFNELFDALDKCENSSDYTRIAKSIKIEDSCLEAYSFWHPKKYTRNCLRRTCDYELIMICWEQEQGTKIHSHNEQECWVKVLQGTFKERQYRNADGIPVLLKVSSYESDATTYMSDHMGFHSLHNSPSSRGITLHLYVGPIDKCQVFDEEKGAFGWEKMSYHSFQGQLTAKYENHGK